MGGRSFRNRWLVRWLFALGGACLVAAMALGALSLGASQHNGPSDAEASHNEELCRARIALGEEPGTGPCAQIAGSLVDDRTELIIAGAALAVLGLGQIVGALRVKITVTEPGVIICNPLRTHRLMWSDIAGFRVERGRAGSMAYAFGRVDRVDGGTHRIEALCAMPWELKDGFRDEHVIRELNAELARQRARRPRRMPAGPPRPVGPDRRPITRRGATPPHA
jgi:hypothetical protein